MDDALIYADEVNTELLTENFEIDVFEIVEEFPGAVASSSIMYNYCDDNSLTITENNTLSINDGSPALPQGGYNPVTFTFTSSPGASTDVDIGDADLVLQELQAAINNSPAEVSASLGAADGNGCYSTLIISKLQVGRIGGPSARAFGGQATVITTNEEAGITLANASSYHFPIQAEALILGFVLVQAEDKTITIVSSDGTSKTYTAKDTEDTSQRHFQRAQQGYDAYYSAAARSLRDCIESADGHNGKIKVDLVYMSGRYDLLLTQVTPGTAGNTTITTTFTLPSSGYPQEPCGTCATAQPAYIPATFTGGSTGPTTSFTKLRGGMDKQVTFIRKYFEKETPQVVKGMLQSPTPIINSPQSYTTSSVEYYFDILVDSEIQQSVACKSAEAFNKQSYYVDLDFDCEEIEQDFVYADIYGRVTDPEICQI